MTRSIGNMGYPIDAYISYRYSNSLGINSSDLTLSPYTSPCIFNINVQQNSWIEYTNGSINVNSTGISYSDTANNVFIGTRADKITGFAGNVAEILWYNGILSTTYRQKMEGLCYD
jgi:hypothetical protein